MVTNDPKLTLKRHTFLQSLGERLPFSAAAGAYIASCIPRELILHPCVNNDLNFRVFETQGYSNGRLTPRFGHDLEEFCIAGQNLFLHDAGNPQADADVAKALLAERQRRINAAISTRLKKMKIAYPARHSGIWLAKKPESMFRTGNGECVYPTAPFQQPDHLERTTFA